MIAFFCDIMIIGNLHDESCSVPARIQSFKGINKGKGKTVPAHVVVEIFGRAVQVTKECLNLFELDGLVLGYCTRVEMLLKCAAILPPRTTIEHV